MKATWRAKVAAYLESMEVEATALQGAKIWLGRSNSPPASEIADDIAAVLEDAGAKVSPRVSGSKGLVCGPEADRLAASHAVVMLAETPGVSAEAMDFCEDGRWEKPIRPRLHVLMPTEHREGYMHARLQQEGAPPSLYEPSHVQDGQLAVTSLNRAISIFKTHKNEERASATPKPTICIVTALQLEFDAVQRVIPGAKQLKIRDDKAELRVYMHAKLQADGGGEHQVVFLKMGMGNNKSVAAATQLMNDYPSVRDIILVGIAAGIPDLTNAKRDVRLGDIVVSDEKGVIKYDMKKDTSTGEVRNHDPRPPSHEWLSAAQTLAADENGRLLVWKDIEECCGTANIKRPKKDILADEADPSEGKAMRRPRDPDRVKGHPRFFFGPIGSADTVMKSAKKRDTIAQVTGVMAVEMEGSGVAEVTWRRAKGYLIVRGTCDYANDGKTKTWQPYAAAVAASFAKVMIESMPVAQTTE